MGEKSKALLPFIWGSKDRDGISIKNAFPSKPLKTHDMEGLLSVSRATVFRYAVEMGEEPPRNTRGERVFSPWEVAKMIGIFRRRYPARVEVQTLSCWRIHVKIFDPSGEEFSFAAFGTREYPLSRDTFEELNSLLGINR